MASLAAAEHLFERFGVDVEIHLNPPNAPGSDVYINPPLDVRAEAFTVGEALFRRKLRNDIRRLVRVPGEFRFVFFYCPGYQAGRKHGLEQRYALGDQGPEVEIWALDRQDIL